MKQSVKQRAHGSKSTHDSRLTIHGLFEPPSTRRESRTRINRQARQVTLKPDATRRFDSARWSGRVLAIQRAGMLGVLTYSELPKSRQIGRPRPRVVTLPGTSGANGGGYLFSSQDRLRGSQQYRNGLQPLVNERTNQRLKQPARRTPAPDRPGCSPFI